MSLPIEIPFLPMEAKIASEIPVGPEWQYETEMGWVPVPGVPRR